MTKEAVLTVYAIYGKQDSETVREQFVIEDTPENRELWAEDTLDLSEVLDNLDDFYEGKTNSITSLKFGDWDEPDSLALVIQSKEDLKEEAFKEYERKIANLDNLPKY